MKLQIILKNIFIIFMISLLSLSVQAAFLTNVPIRLKQADGSELSLFATGDEFHYRLHDAEGFTVLRNKEGWYVYAVKLDGKLSPGKAIVGQADPKTAGIKPGLDISPEEWKALRDEFWKDTPTAKIASQSPSIASGTVNNLVVFIRFSDQTAFTSNVSTYSGMFNDNTAGQNSMYNYFKEATYNNLSVLSTFYPTPGGSLVLSYQDTHPRNYYVPWDTVSNPIGYKSNERTSREHDLLRAATASIASQVPVGLNLDYNNDGSIDNVCFIIRGGTSDWSTLLWPHRWSVYTSPSVYVNSKKLDDYNLQLEDHLANSGVGVLAHEMYHTFGAPDLYHYTSNGISPVGTWDIMGSNTNPPQHMSAYMKYKYGGWISSIPTITLPGIYTLNPLTASSGNCYKIPTNASGTEFFIVEYRRKTGTFENSLSGSGLIIHRINTMAGNGNADGPPDEIYTYRPGGTLITNGTPSQAFFNSTVGRTAFNDTTNPSCFLSNGNNAHINIFNVSSAGGTISFQVSMSPIANYSADLLNSCTYQTITFTDVSGGDITSRLWTFTPNNVVFVNGTGPGSPNPQVQFTAQGDYTVSLAISGPMGNNTMVKTNYIHITIPVNPPFTDDFESGTFTSKQWYLENPDGQKTWDFTSSASGNGSSTKSIWMNFYNYDNTGAIDELSSPVITIPQSGDVKLKFKVAYRAYSSTYLDSLKVAIYSNCGATLASVPYAKGYATLPTGSDVVTPFTPSSASDWRTDSIDLAAYHGQTIILKFIAVNGYGNNIYLDDINLTSSYVNVVANFTASQSAICENGSITFTDQSLGSPTSWSWNFGDGATSTAQNPTHQYLTPGLKTITLTASKAGSTNTVVKSDYIMVNAIPLVSLGNDTILPLFDSLILDAGAGPWSYLWNTGETSQLKKAMSTGIYSVTVSSSPGCFDTDSIYVKIGFSDVFGNVTYLNSSNTPMNGVIVSIKSGTTVIQTDTTDQYGQYYFTNISPGSYSLESFCQKTWGGVNATDALAVMRHFVNLAPMTGLKLKAASVDNNVTINAFDAMLISRRYSGQITSFPAGDWVFDKPTFNYQGNSDMIQNINALCVGDANGSYSPGAKLGESLSLQANGNIDIDLSGLIMLPITADQDLLLGAVSMIINFPSATYDITGVNGPVSEDSNLDYHFADGSLVISWFSVSPVFIKAGDPIVRLSLLPKGPLTSPFLPQLVPGSELADDKAVIYPEVKLYYPQINTHKLSNDLLISVFPNPGNGVFSLKAEGAGSASFSMEIHDVLGSVVYKETGVAFHGTAEHILDLSDQPDGIYFLQLTSSETRQIEKIVKQGGTLKK